MSNKTAVEVTACVLLGCVTSLPQVITRQKVQDTLGIEKTSRKTQLTEEGETGPVVMVEG